LALTILGPPLRRANLLRASLALVFLVGLEAPAEAVFSPRALTATFEEEVSAVDLIHIRLSH
jgi:hypothetical protein